MKMQNLYKTENLRYKKKVKVELICLLITFILILIMAFIFYSAIFKDLERSKKLNQTKSMLVFDTTYSWKDNFDSTYVFNGCIHYTHKSI